MSAAVLVVSYPMGRELVQPALSSLAVVIPINPDGDGQPQVLPVLPSPTVQNLLLQQGDERFHSGIVRACTTGRSSL